MYATTFAVLLAACGHKSMPLSAVEAVSTSCDAAMFAYANATVSTGVAPPTRATATVTDCRTKPEWLAAVIPYTTLEWTGCVVCGSETANKVYASMCRANATAPACLETG